MILHLFLGDLYVDKFPSAVRYLKLVVKIDECREHGIASDLYLSDNIVRFNQTIHFPLNDDTTHINEIELSLICIHADLAENLLGSAQFVCTTGEHSITKTINLHDHRGVPVGKVPVTSFYHSSAIKLGDRVMFKPTYTPTAKEHAFLLHRRFREMHKTRNTSSNTSNKPVTFNEDIEHRLNNEVRDLMTRDFKIVTSNRVKKKPATASTAPMGLTSSGVGKSAAKDSMTYNPGMTRNGAMSDAARGRVAPKMPIGGTKKPKSKSKAKPPAHVEPPKLRTTYMSVGYVKDKQWPEKSTGATQRNLYRIQQASEMKLQILKDIALTVKQRNIRTQAKQEAIRQKKMQVEVDEGKLKRVLVRKENEIQLLKGTLTHLRLTNALQQSDPPPRKASNHARHSSFSRLSHLTYPNPSDSSFRRSGTLTSARRASTPTPTSALRSSSAGPQHRLSGTPAARVRRNSAGQNVSFFSDLSRHATPAPVLYHPMSEKKSAYDSRAKRSAPVSGYNARPSQEELVDQLSDIFDTDFQEDRANHLHPAAGSAHNHEAHEPVLQSTYGRAGSGTGSGHNVGRHIAKDWLANARASINEYHRPTSAAPKGPGGTSARSSLPRTASPQGVGYARPASNVYSAPVRSRGAVQAGPSARPTTSSAAVMRVHRSQTPQRLSTAPRPQATADTHTDYHDFEERTASADVLDDNEHLEAYDVDSNSEDDRRLYEQNQNTVAVPGFLNALVNNHEVTGSGEFNRHGAEMDTTVSSIAVGDIPWMPPQVSRAAQSSTSSSTTAGNTASATASASWRDVYNTSTNTAPTVVMPAVGKEASPTSANHADASPDHSMHSSDSLENLSRAQVSQAQVPSQPELQSTVNYAAASSTIYPNNTSVPVAPTASTIPRPMSAGAAARLQRNQQYTLQSTMSASTDRPSTQRAHDSAGTFPARGNHADQVKGLLTSHRRAGEPLSTSTEHMDDFAKSQFSIRFDGTDLRVPPVRSSSSTAAKQEIVARQLEKNRRYDANKTAGKNTSNLETREESSAPTTEGCPEEESEPTTDLLNTSLSEQLQQKIRTVYERVSDLEGRAGTMKQQRKDDRVPQGWVRKTLSASASATSTHTAAANATSSTTTGTGTRSVTAAARKSTFPVPPASSTTTSTTTAPTTATTTTTATATASKVFSTTLDDSGSPAEEDLKILFEDASSESSDSREFDLVRHKEAVATRA